MQRGLLSTKAYVTHEIFVVISTDVTLVRWWWWWVGGWLVVGGMRRRSKRNILLVLPLSKPFHLLSPRL
jgi:hypothetical protein